MAISTMVDRAKGSLADNNPNAAFDPASIGMIFEIIKGLIEAFQNCRKDEAEAVAMSKNPSRLQRRMVKNRVRREIGRRAYREQGPDMVQAVLDSGADTNVAEMKAAYDEVD